MPRSGTPLAAVAVIVEKVASRELLAAIQSTWNSGNIWRRVLAVRAALLIALVLAVLSSPAVQAQLPQTSFGVEGPMQRAIRIPASALAVLRSDTFEHLLQYCEEQRGTKLSDIPASWFVGSQVDVRHDVSALVVRGEGECLQGAHITQFWLLTQSARGWRIAFTGRADGLNVLNTHTNGYRDLRLVHVQDAGRAIEYVRFHFSKDRYREGSRRVVQNEK